MEDGGFSLTGSKKEDQKEEKYVIHWKLSHSKNKYCVFVQYSDVLFISM